MMTGLHNLSARDLNELIAAMRSGRVVNPFTPMMVQRILSSNETTLVSTDLNRLASNGFGIQQIIQTLEILCADRDGRGISNGIVDLVTTGPEDHAFGNRDTSVVVRDMFTTAANSVLVAGYVVYQGNKLFQALADQMQHKPDLKVRLFLDIQRGQGDTSAPDELVSRFAFRFKNNQWPKDCPLPDLFYDPRSLELGQFHTSLHAKCIVVDDRSVFVSSANFTEAAQLRNIEIGIKIEHQSIARRITLFFETMISQKSLIQISLGK